MPHAPSREPDRSAARSLGRCWATLLVATLGGSSLSGCLVFHRRGDLDVVRMDQSPAEATKFFAAGLKCYEAGSVDQAIVQFEKTIASDPSHGRAHNNLGLLYFDRHQLALAASHFETASQLMPGDATPVNNLGMTLEKGGRMHDALEYYERAAAMNPGNPLYLGNLVRGKLRLGDRDELVRSQLQDLLMIETRPEWIFWIEDQLAMELNPLLDRGGGDMELTAGQSTAKPSSGRASQNASRVIGPATSAQPSELNGPGSLPEPIRVPIPDPLDSPIEFDAMEADFFELP